MAMADWSSIRTEYVHGTDTMRELAAKRGIKAAGLMRRAATEGWDSERKRVSAEVSKAASITLQSDRASLLAKFNEDDLKVASALKSKAAQMLKTVETPQDMRALSAVFEVAQRVGRLAIGAETAISVVQIDRIERVIVDPR